MQLIPDKKEYAAGRHRRAAGAGAVLSGRGRRDVAAQRHRQDRAHHARPARRRRSRCRSPTRWCRTCTCRSTSSAWRRAPTTRAIRIRSCRSGPAYAVGAIDLPVPPKQRTLDGRRSRRARRSSRPARRRSSRVDVKDAAGRPVANAEAAVIVVDEAILALTGYQFPNPIDAFYPQRGADTRDHYSRAYVKLAQPDAGDARAGDARRTGGASTARGDARRRRRRRRADGRRSRRRAPSRRRADAPQPMKRRRVDAETAKADGEPRRTSTAGSRPTADRDPLELQPARGVRAGGEDRRRRQRDRRGQGARQPDALSHRRDRGRRATSSSARARAR